MPTEEIISVAESVLKNIYFKGNKKVCKQISGTAIGTKFARPYACIFMEEMGTSFLKTQQLQSFIWLRYIDDISFIWTDGEEQLKVPSIFEKHKICLDRTKSLLIVT